MKKAIVSLSAVCLALLLGACCTICCKKATAEKFTVNIVDGEFFRSSLFAADGATGSQQQSKANRRK